jgi:hypothetical protein
MINILEIACNWILLLPCLLSFWFGEGYRCVSKNEFFVKQYFAKAEMNWIDFVGHGCHH